MRASARSSADYSMDPGVPTGQLGVGPPGCSPRRWTLLAVAVLTGAFVRAVSAGFLPGLPHDAAVFFLPDARTLFEDGLFHWAGLSATNPPTFPMLIALVARAVGDLEVAAVAISVVCGALIVWPTLSLAEFVCPGRPSIHAAALLLAVTHPFLIRFASEPVGDSAFALFFAVALRAGFGFIAQPSPGRGLGFGSCVGIAYLFRPEALGLPVLAAAALAWSMLRARTWVRGSALGFAAVVIALAPAVAWNLVFVHERLGVWSLSPKAGLLVNFEKSSDLNNLATLNAEKTMTLHEAALASPKDYQSFSLGEFREVGWDTRLRAFVRNLGEFVRYLVEAGHPLVLALAVWGLWLSRSGVRFGVAARRFFWGGLAILASYAIVLSVFYVSRRFLLPFLPLVIPWAGVGVADLADRARTALRVRREVVLGAVAVVLLLGSVHRAGWTEARWWERPERELGRRILVAYGPGQTIVSSKGKVTWYANGRHLFLPVASMDDIVRYMTNRDARLLVLERRSRHRDVEFERALASDERWREVDGATGAETNYRLFELVR